MKERPRSGGADRGHRNEYTELIAEDDNYAVRTSLRNLSTSPRRVSD